MTAQDLAGEDARIVRVMPNTPCLVGETASAMCLGGKATEEDAEIVRALFSSVGSIVQVQLRTPCIPAEKPSGASLHSLQHAACACELWPACSNVTEWIVCTGGRKAAERSDRPQRQRARLRLHGEQLHWQTRAA